MIVDSHTDPDFSLVVRFRSGDLIAFEALVGKYKRPIVNLATRILQDIHEAYDIAQNVFLQAYRALANFEFACKLSTWLYTLTRNLCLNELRRRSRHRYRSLDEPQNPGSLEIEDSHSRLAFEVISYLELNDKLEEAVGSLPEPQRTGILLWRDRQMTYEEIAEALHLSVAATKSLIHRGRKALKQRLTPYLIELI